MITRIVVTLWLECWTRCRKDQGSTLGKDVEQIYLLQTFYTDNGGSIFFVGIVLTESGYIDAITTPFSSRKYCFIFVERPYS